MGQGVKNARILKLSFILLSIFFAISIVAISVIFPNKNNQNTGVCQVSAAESTETVVEAPKPDETGLGIGYTSILYDSSNGLPTSEANAVAQTANGFIWIGGYSGLIRYDGNDFYRYDASMGITSVVSLYVDSKDRLWIGTNDNGIALYQGDSFKFYGRQDGLNSVSIRSIAEDSEGNIIVATTSGIAYIDTELELHILDIDSLNEEYIYSVKNDNKGTIYGVTTNGSFFYIENLELKGLYSGVDMGIGAVYSICPDNDNPGYVYLGTEGSDVVYGDITAGMEDFESRSAQPQVNINAIMPVQDGDMWICADNGIGYLSSDGKYVEVQNLPMDNSIDDMMIDYEGNLWFVSSRQGVLKIAPSQFTDINLISGLPSMVVNATCLYDNQLYIGTDSGLYVVDEEYKQIENSLTELLDGIRVRSIKKDNEGNMWLCTYGDFGLICYHSDGTYDTYNVAEGICSDHVRTVEAMEDGRIAVATGGGLNIIKDNQVIAAYDDSDGITNTEILSLCQGDNGDIYFGSDGGGLFILRSDGTIDRKGVDDGLESEVILRIKKDPSEDLYWIITSNSISYMRNEEITTLKEFPYSNNFDMYFDENNGIWILSSNGIYVVNRDELIRDGEYEYTFYDSSCGMPYSITANSRSFLTEDGTLYMCGASGVSSININDISSSNVPVKLAVPYIEIDDEIIVIPESGEITIPSGTKRLTIYGYVLTYSLDNPCVSYYLEGFDDEIMSVSRQELQPVSYTNLQGGQYKFHLAVIDTMTGEEEYGIQLIINKKKALKEKPVFWIIILTAVILLGVLLSNCYTRHKTRELRRKQQESKIFISQMIHAFARAIDVKDRYTNGHSIRVAEYAAIIAEKMGYSEDEVENVKNIGMLHDIGKLSISNDILNKPGKLTEEEYNIIKKHAENGYDILKEIEIFPDLALGAGYHHERIDGGGYPSGKKGDDIPMVAQIIAVADTFDAMNSTRPYRKKMNMEDIKAELKRVAGTQLNQDIVEVIISLIDEGRLTSLEEN